MGKWHTSSSLLGSWKRKEQHDPSKCSRDKEKWKVDWNLRDQQPIVDDTKCGILSIAIALSFSFPLRRPRFRFFAIPLLKTCQHKKYILDHNHSMSLSIVCCFFFYPFFFSVYFFLHSFYCGVTKWTNLFFWNVSSAINPIQCVCFVLFLKSQTIQFSYLEFWCGPFLYLLCLNFYFIYYFSWNTEYRCFNVLICKF